MSEYKWLFEILFGGLGTAIIVYLFFNKTNKNVINQKQKSGKDSVNIQAGHNIKIGNKGTTDGKK